MNRHTEAQLGRLARLYDSSLETPSLHEVEKFLRTVEKRANRTQSKLLSCSGDHHHTDSSDIDKWVIRNMGWSLPCSEAMLLFKKFAEPTSRIIDVGAGLGLWTRVLRNNFVPENIIGIDPKSENDDIIKSTFREWYEATDGLQDNDIVLLVWPPCSGQEGEELGTEVLNSIGTDQILIYVGGGPHGGVGTQEFYERLGRDFEELATEPIPKIIESQFPRDFARAYQRKLVMQS